MMKSLATSLLALSVWIASGVTTCASADEASPNASEKKWIADCVKKNEMREDAQNASVGKLMLGRAANDGARMMMPA